MAVQVIVGDQMVGTFLFQRGLEFATMAKVLSALKALDPDRWIDLHLRAPNTSNGTRTIGLRYKLEQASQTAFRKAFFSFKQCLERELGFEYRKGGNTFPSHVISWDIGTVEAIT